jgi:hypothetical protein
MNVVGFVLLLFAHVLICNAWKKESVRGLSVRKIGDL